MKTKALVILGPGSNRDRDVAEALEAAGAEAQIVPVASLPDLDFGQFGLLVIPGGFSYGDALGAGALLALDLRLRFAEKVEGFVSSGRPVLGICNGFQALVRSGILAGPGGAGRGGREGEERDPLRSHDPGTRRPVPGRSLTLARNARGNFECRWVRLVAPPSRCLWTEGLAPFSCPVAHGEGRVAFRDAGGAEALGEAGLVALRYAGPGGEAAGGAWPANPNGSAFDIAGICNEAGNVLGLMPHPENAIRPRRRGGGGGNEELALRLFRNGIERARSL